jgi:hypothetical protein
LLSFSRALHHANGADGTYSILHPRKIARLSSQVQQKSAARCAATRFRPSNAAPHNDFFMSPEIGQALRCRDRLTQA